MELMTEVTRQPGNLDPEQQKGRNPSGLRPSL